MTKPTRRPANRFSAMSVLISMSTAKSRPLGASISSSASAWAIVRG